MIPARTIERKRDGQALAPDELGALLDGFRDTEVSDAQMAAFLMAVVFQGLSPAELDVMVDAMIRSGSVMTRRSSTRPRLDKHSTGGVGDKVSLVLAPLAAELGLEVPMMSGRGLGHTGGTLDKLESIPGFTTGLSLAAFEDAIQANGAAMIGQTEEIAPLDRRLYALRSATGTVGCVPLIASSIMSKKLSEDLDGLVLDVKVGRGSFLSDRARSTELARTMVQIGGARGVPTVALLTRMEWPLGRAIGNALEVAEAVCCLRGDGPADVVELTTRMAAEMLLLAGLESDASQARVRAETTLSSGRAAERFAAMIVQQGGDPRVIDDPTRLPLALQRSVVLSPSPGIVRAIDPLALGWGVVELGGGRRGTEGSIDPSVGFELVATVGDAVEIGDPLGWVHAADVDGIGRGTAVLEGAYEISMAGDDAVATEPLIYDRIGPEPTSVGALAADP